MSGLVVIPKRSRRSMQLNSTRGPRPVVARRPGGWAEQLEVRTLMSAAVPYNSNGFEAPTFVPGNVVGQDNWVAVGTGATATVQNNVGVNLSAGLAVTRTNGDVRFFPHLGAVSRSDLGRFVSIDWDMSVPRASSYSQNAPFGPFFGVEAYGPNTAQPGGGGGATAPVIGAGGVDASTGDVLYEAPGTGYLTETHVKVNFDQYYNFDLRIDYATNTYALFVNGQKAIDTATVKSDGYGFVDPGITGFADADVSALAAQPEDASSIESGTAYFDDYAVQTSDQPRLLNTVVGDGTAQRSEVRSFTLLFDEPVKLAPGAVSLFLQNTGGSGTNDGSAPTDASSALGQPYTTDGGNTYIVPVLKNTAFTDASGSLKDGIYTLVVNPAQVTSAEDPNQTLKVSDRLFTTFHRLFGDINGDGQVNNLDYFYFRKAFLSTTGNVNFQPGFDYNADGQINNVDYFQFRKRFLKSFSY